MSRRARSVSVSARRTYKPSTYLRKHFFRKGRARSTFEDPLDRVNFHLRRGAGLVDPSRSLHTTAVGLEFEQQRSSRSRWWLGFRFRLPRRSRSRPSLFLFEDQVAHACDRTPAKVLPRFRTPVHDADLPSRPRFTLARETRARHRSERHERPRRSRVQAHDGRPWIGRSGLLAWSSEPWRGRRREGGGLLFGRIERDELLRRAEEGVRGRLECVERSREREDGERVRGGIG
jgi:hypothetical protein